MLRFIKYFESFLLGGRQPLYHFTTSYYLNKILQDDTIKIGFYDNMIDNKYIKMVSLTRNMNFSDITHHRELDVRINLNGYKLKQNYKIIPYDFAINNRLDLYTKSNIKRTKVVEFEEIIKTDISNVGIYIDEITFVNVNDYYLYRDVILRYLKKYPKIKFNIDDRKKL